MQNKTEIFVEKAFKIHGNKYDYSLVEYLHCMKKVTIICHRHGTFEQTPNGHLTTGGCRDCGVENIKKKQRATTEYFISKAQVIHGNMYDYSEVIYVNNATKVNIICGKHGVFSQTPNNHIQGTGCPKCKFEKTGNLKRFSTEDFICKAKETHGDIYDYSKVDYKNQNVNVEIVCKHHGSFWQKPNNHIFDRGCPSCAVTGYHPSESGYLYVMESSNITKIGITNLTPEHRSKDISRSFGGKFQVIHEWYYEDGSIPDKVETTILRYLRDNYSRPEKKFEGSSECFLDVDQEDLLNKIKEELEKYDSNRPNNTDR